MAQRGHVRADYCLPRPGTRKHLVEMLLRRPRGITSREGIELGLLATSTNLHVIMAQLRDFSGYEIAAIDWEPGKKKGFVRYAITARYNWDMSIAEDLIANRENRARRVECRAD